MNLMLPGATTSAAPAPPPVKTRQELADEKPFPYASVIFPDPADPLSREWWRRVCAYCASNPVASSSSSSSSASLPSSSSSSSSDDSSVQRQYHSFTKAPLDDNDPPNPFDVDSVGSMPSMPATGLGVVDDESETHWSYPNNLPPGHEDTINVEFNREFGFDDGASAPGSVSGSASGSSFLV